MRAGRSHLNIRENFHQGAISTIGVYNHSWNVDLLWTWFPCCVFRPELKEINRALSYIKNYIASYKIYQTKLYQTRKLHIISTLTGKYMTTREYNVISYQILWHVNGILSQILREIYWIRKLHIKSLLTENESNT